MVHSTRVVPCGGLRGVLVGLCLRPSLCLLDLARRVAAKEVEVAQLISQTNHPVLAQRLIHLHTRHTQRQHACGAIFELTCHIVLHGEVDTEERGKRLVDAHRRYIIHRRGHSLAGGGVGDISKSVHIFAVGAI